MKRFYPFLLRAVFALVVCIPALWINGVLFGAPVWSIGLIAGIALATWSKSIPNLLRMIGFAALGALTLLITSIGGWSMV